MALQAKELIYGAIALAISFIGIAGFFALLDAPYLAMLQIAIYVGAVVVLILFTIMLVRRERGEEMDKRTDAAEGSMGLWLAGLLALAISGVVALAGTSLPTQAPAGESTRIRLRSSFDAPIPCPIDYTRIVAFSCTAWSSSIGKGGAINGNINELSDRFGSSTWNWSIWLKREEERN